MSNGTLSTTKARQAEYANGIDFWRQKRGYTWRQLADKAQISLPVLRRTALTAYRIYEEAETGDTLAVPRGAATGVLASDRLRHLAAMLDTSLTLLMQSPSDLQKNFSKFT